jgi:hypothetical protein
MGIINNIHKNILSTAQNNLLYIVSSYFSQEKFQNTALNQFIMCQPDTDKKDKIIENYPILQYIHDEQNIKYTKYEYRQIKVLQMILLTPRIFIVLTEEEIILWNDSLKISLSFFDKYRNNQNLEILDKNLIRFDDDLFSISYEIKSKNQKKKNEDDIGFKYYLFSAKKIINEGKISEIFFINKINQAFPINKNQIFVINEKKIQIIDILSKDIIKEDNNLDYIQFDISYAKYIFNDLVLLSCNKQNKSVIYSADKKSLLYFIDDSIINSFNLGKNKVIIIGPKIKEILLLPDMYVLSLEQYETDIFNSLENKSFYEINDTCFLFINHKSKKLKEVFINELNELIITKEIICPTEFITFCPFVYTYEEYTRLLCSLFICKDQTYQILNHELLNLIEGEESEQVFSSIKRLFLNYFFVDENYYDYFKYNFNNNNLNKSLTKQNNSEYSNMVYISYSIICSNGNSTLNFALYKNKKMYELNSFCNFFEPNLKSEIIYSNNFKDIYIIAIIKNILVYIIKINGLDSTDVNIKHNFGNIKTKGIINIGSERAFLFYDKKAIIINVNDSFKLSKLIPIENFSFPFNILYAYLYKSNILILSIDKLYLFNLLEKKIKKEIKLNFQIIIDDNIENIDINIIKIKDNIYILIVEENYMLFDINNFEKLKEKEILRLKSLNMLFFKSYKENFDIKEKDIIKNKVLNTFTEKTDEQRHKMKYLSPNKIFVGTYPNKFYIFENNEDTSDND